MNTLIEVEQRLLGDIYTANGAREALEYLCDDCSPRWQGTEGERKAATFILAQFERAGLQQCRREPFDYVGWARGSATLRVVAPVERTIPCFSLPMSPAASLQGPLVLVGDGAPGEFEAAADRLPGAVAMVSSRPPQGLNRTVHRSEKYQRAALGGAALFLYVNQYPGYGPETGSIASDREALIPGIAISFEDGALLQRLERRHGPLTLSVETTDRCLPLTSWNLVGDLPGERADEWVIVGCHYDGHDISQGAHDPASGMVALLEAARALAAHAGGSLRCGLRFIGFGVEETGLVGAHRYVAQHLDELDRIRFMLNLDAAGSPGPKGLMVNCWPELTPVFARWEREMAADLPIGRRTSAFSDHYPFFVQGVPTAMMGDPHRTNTGRGFDHTAFDTVDKVRIADVREAAGMAARLALRLSREDPWPITRRSLDAVQALIAAEPSLEGQQVREALDRLYAARDSAARG
jgi:aminopeptidase YwaD